jgi:two-component system sensor histidine kinase CpxA
MRSIFFKLFLSFSLIIVLAGFVSALVMFSLTRHSVESFGETMHQQMQSNIARSVVLVGQSAYVMHTYRSAGDFATYIRDIEKSMQVRLYLRIDNNLIPQNTAAQSILDNLPAGAFQSETPYIQDKGQELVVVQRLAAPDGKPYVVIGVHQRPVPPFPGVGPGFIDKPGLGFPPPEVRPPYFGGHDPESLPPRQWLWFELVKNGKKMHTFVLLLIAVVVCFKLARSLSAPLDRLRRTSRDIAAGNLSARVGTSLGKPGNEIGDLGRDFDHMAERMERLIKSQKRLLLDISHELRSPLTRLNLALELARKHFQTDNDANLERIAKESERLNELIGQLLTLTRIESQEGLKETAPIRLDDLLREISEDIDFETKNIDKGVHILNLERLSVAGSHELLRQAVENVVRNATYYTQTGSRVEISLSTIMSDETKKPAAVIRVRDFGPGVPEEKLAHIVEPFFRVAEARSRDKGGTGIGLAIANQAVQLHGGSIHFTNAAGKDGLVVEIHLPLLETVH